MPTTALILLMLTGICLADGPRNYRTGAEIEKALQSRVQWSGLAKLDDHLKNLQDQSGVVIVRDRRLDPYQTIRIETEMVPRMEVLSHLIAELHDSAFCVTSQIICVGPHDVVHRLPVLLSSNTSEADRLRKKLPSGDGRRLSNLRNVRWNDLDEPRQILQRIAEESGVRILNPEAVPHDVWGAGELPAVSFSDAATIILNQFELTLNFHETRAEIQIVPVDLNRIVEHRYVVKSADRRRVEKSWTDAVPELTYRWTGSASTVRATLAQHIALQTALAQTPAPRKLPDGKKPGTTSLRTTIFQLTADRATVGQVIDHLRENGIEVEIEGADTAEVRVILGQLVRTEALAEKRPGKDFFPAAFGQHFRTVEVRDDRVILSVR